MTITILPNAKTQFLNGNAIPLAGGSVYMYVPGTTTLKNTYQDSGGTIINSNPITLDGNGECLLWGSGAYRQVVYDVTNNLIWDAVTVDPGYAIMATFNGTSTTAVAIGSGSKSFTTQPGLQFFPGGTLNIASNASALNYMNGTVTSYNTTTGALVVSVLSFGGSGTHSDWNISVSGIQGPPGTVTAITVATANGLAGTSSGGGTPQLTLTTSITGIVKGNGTSLSAATAGVDYVIPSGSISGNAGTVTTNANLTGPVTSVGNATSVSNGVITEAMQLLSDNTTNNVSTSKHGYAPKAPADATKFLNGAGVYSTPVTSALIGTSTTSLAIATGTITFTTQSGLTLGAGQYVVIPSHANPANYFFGQVTSYSGTTLVVSVTVDGGSGTYADWDIFISGPGGAAGTVSTTGSPANGNLTKFSGSNSITNGDLSGDISTTGSLVATLPVVNSNVGSFTCANVTVNAKGQVTAASSGFSTGDVKLTFKGVPDSGWVFCDDGTIGSATSGATNRANADTVNLFTLLWNNISNTYAPVSGGRGANAAADFAANKTIQLAQVLGRTLGVAGTGSGLTNRALGQTLGEETHTPILAEMFAHTHTATVVDPGHAHSFQFTDMGRDGSLGQYVDQAASTSEPSIVFNTFAAATGITVSNASQGSSTAFNVMQPTSFVNMMIKL